MADEKLTALSALTTPTDDDLMYLVDAPGTTPASKKITWANIKATLKTYFDTLYGAAAWGALTGTITAQTDLIKYTQLAEGQMTNGRISVTVASNDLTVALKTLAGTDPSASDPVYVMLGGVLRTRTSALSVTLLDSTNWFNSAGAELQGKELDYFVYLGYNATDGVTIGVARIPYGVQYDSFSTTNTNEKFCAISTITNAAAADPYSVIGRCAATLSAVSLWSVPTFTTSNLIQRPIFESRWMTWVPTISAVFSANPTAAVYQFKLTNKECWIRFREAGNGTSSSANDATYKLPFTAVTLSNMYWFGFAFTIDNNIEGLGSALIGSAATVMSIRKAAAANAWTNSGARGATLQAPIVYGIG